MTREMVQLFPPVAGMNYRDEITQLAPNEALNLNDVILDGQVRKRNGFTQFDDNGLSSAYNGAKPMALATLIGPEDRERLYGVVHEQNSPGGDFIYGIPWDEDGNVGGSANNYSSNKANGPPLWVEIRPAILGLSTYSLMSSKGPAANNSGNTETHNLSIVTGADVFNAALTGTLSVTQGATAVTGSGTSFTTELAVGAFLFDTSNQYIGTVKEIGSNTSLTLESGAVETMSGASSCAGTFFRNWMVRHGKGRITTKTTDETVTGHNTKFEVLQKGHDAGDWYLFRRVDGAYIGTVSSITNNESLELGAVAAIALENERFIAIQKTTSTGASIAGIRGHCGYLSAAWSGRQWYANSASIPNLSVDSALDMWEESNLTDRVCFSAPDDLEDMDWSDDGDWFNIGSTGSQEPIITLFPTENALLVFKHDEVYAITGTSPANYRATRIGSDGVWTGNAVTAVGGGAAWIGSKGVWFFDGVSAPVNLTDAGIGEDLWSVWTENYSDGSYADDGRWATSQVGLTYAHGHLLASLNDINTARIRPFSTSNSASSVNPDQRTLVINLQTGALAWWHNCFIYADTKIEGKHIGIIQWGASDKPGLINIDELFEDNSQRDFDTLTDASFEGPWFFYEAPPIWLGTQAQYTKWIAFQPEYRSTAHSFRADVFTGRTDELEAGADADASYDIALPFDNTQWIQAHMRFAGGEVGAGGEKRDHYLRMRVYESAKTAAGVCEYGHTFFWGTPIGEPGRRGASA